MDKSKKDDHKETGKKEPIKDFFKDVVFVFGAFFILNSFVLASFEVPTGSMEKEIMAGDFLFVNKFLYGGTTPRNIPLTNVTLPWFRLPAFRSVERGDVIVFEFPGQRDEIRSREFLYYLKRAMALSGDTVLIRNRVVYINGEQAPLPRNITFDTQRVIPEGVPDQYGRIFPVGAPYNEDNWGPMVVPSKGDVIPLSRENFTQLRVFIGREGHTADLTRDGRITIDGIEADSYTVERNYMFGMGDHRDNSLDSRFWGFIPEENIVGTPMIVYWSWSPEISIVNFFAKISTIRFGRIGTIIR